MIICKGKCETFVWSFCAVGYFGSEVDSSKAYKNIYISEHVGILSSINLSLIFK